VVVAYFKTADKLFGISNALFRDYAGDLNALNRVAADRSDLERRIKQLGKGIGDVQTAHREEAFGKSVCSAHYCPVAKKNDMFLTFYPVVWWTDGRVFQQPVNATEPKIDPFRTFRETRENGRFSAQMIIYQ
jgi:hypothetical protein